MGDGDESTVNTITSYRKTISDLIQGHQGQVVDAPGDDILAEFNSVFHAVSSTIEIQGILEVENAKFHRNRRMAFRIGINMGDILLKDYRIYGDGVNIAARIERLAVPGGICNYNGVYDQVEGKIEDIFADLGTHFIKNIRKIIWIYEVLLYPTIPKELEGYRRNWVFICRG
jgi:adenylate cyclase